MSDEKPDQSAANNGRAPRGEPSPPPSWSAPGSLNLDKAFPDPEEGTEQREPPPVRPAPIRLPGPGPGGGAAPADAAQNRAAGAGAGQQAAEHPAPVAQPRVAQQAAPQQAATPGAQHGQSPGHQASPAQAAAGKAPGARRQLETVPVKIGLWGSKSSGKTTYLASLSLAVGIPNPRIGEWAILGDDPASTQLLADLKFRMVMECRFPEATLIGEDRELSWIFVGDVANSEFAPRKIIRRKRSVINRFRLEVVDSSGEVYDHTQGKMLPTAEKAVQTLSEAQGLIYLFDPITDHLDRKSAGSITNTLTQLGSLMKDQMIGKYLPQHLAVCITKFDDPRIVQQARRQNLVGEEDGMYRVTGNNAERFFKMLCNGQFWQGSEEDHERTNPGAKFIHDQVLAHFDPERTRYYAISSVGLLRGRDGRVDKDDFSNVKKAELDNGEEESVIRGPIEPINILEPLISLQQRILGNRRANV